LTVHPDRLRYKTNRAKLDVRKKPYRVLLAPNIHLCYRRCAGPGTWSVAAEFGLKRFSLADDREPANGVSVMDFGQACAHALKLVRGSEGGADKPLMVKEALDAYRSDLELRGKSIHNAKMVENHMPSAWLAKVVALLTEVELSNWRNALVKNAGLKTASANRIGRSFKAALALASRRDRRITNTLAWRNGLRPIPGAAGQIAPRDNFYLSDASINAIVRACYAVHGEDYGDLLEVLAATGTRESQALKIWPHDIQETDKGPRLMIWCSSKGRERAPEQRAFPIPQRLAVMLRKRIIARGANRPVFDRIWNISEKFREALVQLGMDETLTPYLLRHSSIIRQIRSGTAMRVIAFAHDTSVAMIEKTYARYLNDAADDLRNGLLTETEPDKPANNVVPLAR
jgi:integrase